MRVERRHLSIGLHLLDAHDRASGSTSSSRSRNGGGRQARGRRCGNSRGSARNSPRPIAMAGRSRLVAQIRRKFVPVPARLCRRPVRAVGCLLGSRAAVAPCAGKWSSPISSRNSVPPWAKANAPWRSDRGSRKRPTLVAEELAARQIRDERRTMPARPDRASPRAEGPSGGSANFATSSLPVPAFPRMSVAVSLNRAISTIR